MELSGDEFVPFDSDTLIGRVLLRQHTSFVFGHPPATKHIDEILDQFV